MSSTTPTCAACRASTARTSPSSSLDATVGLGELDLQIATEATRRGCATVLAVNKSDIADARPRRRSRGIAGRKLRQRPPVLAVSALTHAGVAALLEMVALLDTRYTAHIPTAELNRALAALTAERPLPAKGGRRLKMYYMAQYGTSPPRIAIEVNDRTLVTRDFGYFVENRLRGRFELRGRAADHRLQGKMNALDVILFIAMLVAAYLMGAIPFGIVIGKVFFDVDIREHGSGNVGTTNAFRVLGKKAGIAVLACDMLKGYVPAAPRRPPVRPLGDDLHRLGARRRAHVLGLPARLRRQGHRHRQRRGPRSGPRDLRRRPRRSGWPCCS